jgi:hypothetical protein
MKTLIEIILAAILISFLVLSGSVLYFGTFDLMGLSDDNRMDIICFLLVFLFVYLFALREE